MNKTKIEWCDYTINPVKGLCPMACPYCYARRMYKRFGWNPEIRFDWSVANDLAKMKPGSRVFWGSTMELFGDWVDPEWMSLILEAVKLHPELTHIFLTKQSQNLPRRFPDNCWVGASATNWDMAFDALWNFQDVKAQVKFLSFEPLLEWTHHRELEGWLRKAGISWVILGQQTPNKKSTQPQIEWVKEIVEAADKAGIPVFLKDNLKPLLTTSIDGHDIIESHNLWAFKYFKLRQELP